MKKKYPYKTLCTFNVVIDPVDKSKYKEIAKKRDQTLSAFVRDAMKSYSKNCQQFPVESSLGSFGNTHIKTNYDIAI